ncbi:hypothetical protein ACMD2_21209 [Ananas comosus]|uniref:Uncharacterized protein n=1 Tax=Ananas comosus TaxID=4615 RepID=A0A199VV80_ANACO|nr:hypothetical protein ACMD2_21209 [Ananas comosus]
MDKEYPFAFMLASAWFVITILADCVVTIMVARGMRVERFQKRAKKDRSFTQSYGTSSNDSTESKTPIRTIQAKL